MKFANFFISIWIFSSFPSFSQNIPVGAPMLENIYRRLQNKGEADTNCSFTIRPVNLKFNNDSVSGLLHTFYPLLNRIGHSFLKDRASILLLPLTIKQQYDSHHPYGWNDGSMI